MSKDKKSVESKTVKIKAMPGLNGVAYTSDRLFTLEQYNELKYGSGISEVSQEAAQWLIDRNHAVKEKK